MAYFPKLGVRFYIFIANIYKRQDKIHQLPVSRVYGFLSREGDDNIFTRRVFCFLSKLRGNEVYNTTRRNGGNVFTTHNRIFVAMEIMEVSQNVLHHKITDCMYAAHDEMLMTASGNLQIRCNCCIRWKVTLYQHLHRFLMMLA